MNPNNCLDFEKPIAELEAMLRELRHLSAEQDLNISDEIARLEAKSKALTESIFASLTPWQISQIARHPLRPYTLDYVERLFADYQELHGDRAFADDRAIVGGLARLEGRPMLVIGHQKGRDTKEKIYRNFGMPRPEGYRKALRLMKLAERFRLPVVTFIDTPGAYPGIGAEERGQSEAIARNLFEMCRLRVPVICVVIGEGGSGGALAVGVGDRVLMLQYSTYSVISPEGCAAILWKSADKAPDAAEAMGLTADRLLKLKLIDGIIAEPPGGAHRDVAQVTENVRAALRDHLRQLDVLEVDELLEQRYRRLMAYGVFKEVAPATSLQSTWQSSVAALLGKDKVGEG
ncbi:MAG: acetyl-CoA carboxylase carboxyltransferase subunit alpha [Candidatus Competibacter sp.]|nr:acetyl-CoA carboxylase carboxyltransferase subunit alpha [Candidatus Competibacter sp.]